MKSNLIPQRGYVALFLGAVMALAALAGVVSLSGSAPAVLASQGGDQIVAVDVPAASAVPALHKYIIPRTIPGAEGFSSAQWKENSAASNAVLQQMRDEGKQIYWLESFVGKDSVICVYMASGPELLYEHGKRGNFPVNSVIEVSRMIEPATGQ